LTFFYGTQKDTFCRIFLLERLLDSLASQTYIKMIGLGTHNWAYLNPRGGIKGCVSISLYKQ